MRPIKTFVALLTGVLVSCLTAGAATHYVGGDISLLHEYEKAGATYLDNSGKPIADLLPWLKGQGMNSMRVRLFVDPSAFKDNDPDACQSLEYIIPLCKQIAAQGFDLLLDFHYSDTWADPSKQWTPVAWSGLTDEESYAKIYEYTRSVLSRLKEEGIVPALIQPGNEISYGMCWGPVGTPENEQKRAYMGSDKHWDRLGRLLAEAISACREVCPDAKIIIHTERVAETDVQSNFYSEMKDMGIDYDIIGLSYYPFFHGNMSVLDNALSDLEKRFPEKQIMLVETGYPYKWEVPGTDHDCTGTWPYSETGQEKFAADLVADLEKHPSVIGLYWWWPEYNAFDTDLADWYNAPLFDSTTGRATKALTAICSFAGTSGIDRPTADPRKEEDVRYDLCGRRIAAPLTKGIYIYKGRKIAR